MDTIYLVTGRNDGKVWEARLCGEHADEAVDTSAEGNGAEPLPAGAECEACARLKWVGTLASLSVW